MRMRLCLWSSLDAPARRAALRRPALGLNQDLDERVRAIIADVRRDGDATLIRLGALVTTGQARNYAVAQWDIETELSTGPVSFDATVDFDIFAKCRRLGAITIAVMSSVHLAPKAEPHASSL